MKREAFLRRYKAFRDLEERAAWLAEQLETATSDLEQLREEMEHKQAGFKLAEQVLAERLANARTNGKCRFGITGCTSAHGS